MLQRPGWPLHRGGRKPAAIGSRRAAEENREMLMLTLRYVRYALSYTTVVAFKIILN